MTTPFAAPTFSQLPVTYDTLNRLSSVTDSGWSRTFGYDAFGNMKVTSWTGASPNVDIPGPATTYNTKNQRTDQTYNLAGNLSKIQADTIGLTYDAKNRQITAGGTSYSYDGSGRRVVKTSGGNTTVYVYDAMGQLVAEYNSAAQPAPPCTTCYLSYDHLGSVRLITDASARVLPRHDYLPFGEEITPGQAGRTPALLFGGIDDVSQRFTGKERDSESGVDYFGARYYGSALGRWTTPDWSRDPEPVPYASLDDPQTLNLYSYLRNRPLTTRDDDGHVQVCGVAQTPLASKRNPYLTHFDSQNRRSRDSLARRQPIT